MVKHNCPPLPKISLLIVLHIGLQIPQLRRAAGPVDSKMFMAVQGDRHVHGHVDQTSCILYAGLANQIAPAGTFHIAEYYASVRQ